MKHYKYGFLHRYIFDITDPKIYVDHIDRNGLNNQKSNLRLVDGKINKRNQGTCRHNWIHFNGITYEGPTNRSPKGRIRCSWASEERNNKQKNYITKTKSFSINKYGLNEALRLAVQFRIQKMREFDYIIDERSETIEKAILDPDVDMIALLDIDKSKFAGVE